MADEKTPDKMFYVNPDGSGNYELKSVPKPAESVAAIDFDDLPKDQEELVEFMQAEVIPAIAMHVAIAKRFARQLAKMDLSEQNPSTIMTALSKATSALAEASKLIAETTPRTINAMFNFPFAGAFAGTDVDECPCCRRPWPPDVLHDTSGIDA